MNSRDAADTVHVLGQHAMVPMREAIVELRKQGHDALAEELTTLREQWASAVVRHVREAGMRRLARDVGPAALKPPVPAPRPKLRVVTRELPPPQRAGSRARELPGDAS